MILFMKCRCGRNKLLAKQYAQQGYEIKYINLNPSWRKEAESYKTKLPFKVTNGVVERL